MAVTMGALIVTVSVSVRNLNRARRLRRAAQMRVSVPVIVSVIVAMARRW